MPRDASDVTRRAFIAASVAAAVAPESSAAGSADMRALVDPADLVYDQPVAAQRRRHSRRQRPHGQPGLDHAARSSNSRSIAPTSTPTTAPPTASSSATTITAAAAASSISNSPERRLPRVRISASTSRSTTAC